MSSKGNIYCIPGLGIDCRIFQKLNIPSVCLKELNYHHINTNISLKEYAAQLAEKIEDEEPVLMGMSLGGIMAIEIAQIIPVKQLILISSVKNSSEIPAILKFIPKITPSSPTTTQLAVDAGVALKQFYLSGDKEGKDLFETMVKGAETEFINWGFKAISKWDFNQELNVPYFHIHGTADKVFPIKNIDNATTVRGGTHFMIYNKAEIVSERIKQFLARTK